MWMLLPLQLSFIIWDFRRNLQFLHHILLLTLQKQRRQAQMQIIRRTEWFNSICLWIAFMLTVVH